MGRRCRVRPSHDLHLASPAASAHAPATRIAVLSAQPDHRTAMFTNSSRGSTSGTGWCDNPTREEQGWAEETRPAVDCSDASLLIGCRGERPGLVYVRDDSGEPCLHSDGEFTVGACSLGHYDAGWRSGRLVPDGESQRENTRTVWDRRAVLRFPAAFRALRRGGSAGFAIDVDECADRSPLASRSS